MIRNETEYQEASEHLAQERQRLVEHKARLKTAGLAEDEIKRVIDPFESFNLQLKEEVVSYEKLKRGEFDELENSRFKALVPHHKSVTIPCQNLQPVSTTRAEHEQAVAGRVLANHPLHSLREVIETTANVRGLSRQPDARTLLMIQRMQAWQADHASVSSTVSRARR